MDFPPALDYTEPVDLMPRLKPSVREAAAAKTSLLAMEMNIVNRGGIPPSLTHTKEFTGNQNSAWTPREAFL